MDLYKKEWNTFETVSTEKLQTVCIKSEENIVIWQQLYETFHHCNDVGWQKKFHLKFPITNTPYIIHYTRCTSIQHIQYTIYKYIIHHTLYTIYHVLYLILHTLYLVIISHSLKNTYIEYIGMRRQAFYISRMIGGMTNLMGYVKPWICMKSRILKIRMMMVMSRKTPRCLSLHFIKHLDVIVDVAQNICML